MYCVFHDISDHLQRQIMFWPILQKKLGLDQTPTTSLGQNPKIGGEKNMAPLMV